MQPQINRVVIGYGTESGNSEALAQRLSQASFLQAFTPEVLELNAIDLQQFTEQDRLIIITSSFGDGGPPDNAAEFHQAIYAADVLLGLQYAIFGIGDIAYPEFCGFSKELDSALESRAATPFMNRVDADTGQGYEIFFSIWCDTLEKVLQGDARAGKALNLQVSEYGDGSSYSLPILQRKRLSKQAEHAAWHLRLQVGTEPIQYRAGDSLYILPENDPALLASIQAWYGEPSSNASALADRELRRISRSTLQKIADLTTHPQLAQLLTAENAEALEEYLYGRDILDVLQDFCSPQNVSLPQLVNLLPANQPRAYSIASSDARHIDLCIRDVAYEARSRHYQGTATGHLLRLKADQKLDVLPGPNPAFHLPDALNVPLIMVGTGTGIAPFIGFLEQLEKAQAKSPNAALPPTCLVFGERHVISDFLYQERLEQWQTSGTLTTLLTAFSRDAKPQYVQHALVANAPLIWQLLNEGALLYVCGNKAHLGQAIEDAITTIARTQGNLDETQAQAFLQQLSTSKRLRRELY